MSYTVRWRKAIVISIFFHIFFCVAIGYMTVGPTLSPLDEEEFVELDVISMPGDEAVGSEEQLATLSAHEPEVIPQQEVVAEAAPIPEPILPMVSEEPLDSEPAPIKPLPQVEVPVGPNKNKPSPMGTPPVVLVRVEPVQPSDMDYIGRKVVVVLKVKIMENGLPGKVDVVVRSGQKSINDAAIAAAKKYRFEPAKDREGRPMVCSTILSIPFIPR